jgi:uncharacterized membrane protein YkgB
MIAFLNLRGFELIIVIVGILMLFAVANYGRDTQLGYLGSLLLAIITSPILAFIIIYYLKYRARTTGRQ